MAVDPEFLEFSKELFSGLGPIRVGRMFGGAALYVDDAMFAMIIGDELIMKSDNNLSVLYADAGSTPFVYDTRKGPRTIRGMMYLPDSAMDDPEEALDWARRSLVPAQAAALKKQQKKNTA